MRAIKKMDPKYSDYAEIVKKWKGKDQQDEESLVKAILRFDISRVKYNTSALNDFPDIKALLGRILTKE